ncbi:MAG: F0F1 ATP synthase subunit gamma [Alphaproteobacteria bacterium]
MPSLKDLKNRIATTKATQRITQAMKMVAAAKLRRAQEQAEAARPYAERMERMLGSLAGGMGAKKGGPKLLVGTGSADTHLIVLISSDRGLCGGFNANLIRHTRRRILALTNEGRKARLVVVGRKAVAVLKRDMGGYFAQTYEDLAKPAPAFEHAAQVATKVLEMYDAGEFDTCSVVYNKFQSALTQIVTDQQLIPFEAPKPAAGAEPQGRSYGGAVYEYEPSEEQILADLLPRNLSVQIFRAMLESFASEQGARMTAMDSASRNAGDMINSLTLTYNRTRQAFITKELIEIISGAEAL